MPRQKYSTAQHFESLRSDYAAARASRFRRRRTGLAAQGSGADYHYRSEGDYLKLIEQARDMDRNDVVVGPLIDRSVQNMIQDGFRLDPATGDPGVDRELWARWDEWSRDPEQCDVAGELTWNEMERLVPRQMLVDGDILALPTRDGGLQLVEGHRLRTPRNTKQNVVHGVLLDEFRRRLAYWFTKDDIDPSKPFAKVGDARQVPARDAAGERQVFHLYNPRRATQTRGVTALAPVFDALGMFEDINFARLVQQQVVSCFAFLRSRDLGFEGGAAAAAGAQETRGDGLKNEGIHPGMEITGPPGEKIEGFSANVPNAEFFEHVKLILTLVGINVGLPLCVLMLDASETNFSGWRGAVDQARLGFRWNQQALRTRFHSPVYRWKVRQWLADDVFMQVVAEKQKLDVFAHHWHAPTWPYIEPLKDASADLLRVRNALISPRRLHAERGRDWEDIAAEIVEDNALAIRLAKRTALAVNAEFEDDAPVHWRELLSLPTPDGVTVKLAAADDSAAARDGRDDRDG